MEHNISAIWPGWEITSTLGTDTCCTVYEICRVNGDTTERAALKIISISGGAGEQKKSGDGEDPVKQQCDELVRLYRLLGEQKSGSCLVAVDEVKSEPHADGSGYDIHIKMELLVPLHKATGVIAVEEEAVKLGMNVCRALSVCRELGISHHSIKPSNIFITQDGTYKLGLPELGYQASEPKSILRFDAPEIYQNKPCCAGADTYQVGLVMYWLLNKRRGPFMPLPPEPPEREQEEAAVQRILAGEQIPAPVFGSEQLQTIVLKACAFHAEQRYQSSEKMREDLEDVRSEAVSDGVIRGVMSSVIGADAVYQSKDMPAASESAQQPVRQPVSTAVEQPVPTVERSVSTVQQPVTTVQQPVPTVQQPVTTVQQQAEVQDGQKEKKNRKGLILLIVAIVLLVMALLIGGVALIALLGGGDPDNNVVENEEPANESTEVVWSDWVPTLPAFVLDGDYDVETALQYRSAPLYYFEGEVADPAVYTVCYTGFTEWSEPGEWQDEPIEATDLVQVEVGVKYRYRDLYSYKYSEGFVTKTGYAWGAWKYSDTPVEARSGREVEEVPIYRCCTRLMTYYCAKSTEWGEWGDEVIHPSQIAVVNTRTVYRYTWSQPKEPSMQNFPETVTRYVSRFVDVPNDTWYGANTDNWVGTAVEMGVMSANEYLSFRPTEQATVAEVLCAAVALRLIYNGENTVMKETSPWYNAYVARAYELEIIARGDFADFNKPATREEAAYILSRALPAEEVSGTNLVTAILDMSGDSKYYMSVLQLAKAGVLTWSEPEGYFRPQDLITRAEIAVIVSRIAYPNLRYVADVH